MLCLCWDTHRCTCQATFNSLLCIGKFEQMFGGELYILVSDIGTIRKPAPSHQYHFVGSCLRLSGRHIHCTNSESNPYTHSGNVFHIFVHSPWSEDRSPRSTVSGLEGFVFFHFDLTVNMHDLKPVLHKCLNYFVCTMFVRETYFRKTVFQETC